MLSCGCFNAAFWSLIFQLDSYVNEDHLICKGNAGNIDYDPFCVYTGFTVLATVNWVSVWTFFIAFQLWLSIVHSYPQRKLDKMRLKMVFFAAFVSSLIFIPLGAGNIGYEWTGGTLHMCLNKTITKPKFYHYAFTFAPVAIFNFALPVLLMTQTIWFINKRVSVSAKSQQDRMSESFDNRNSVAEITDSPMHQSQEQIRRRERRSSLSTIHVYESFSQFYKLNGTSLKFLVIINCTTLIYLFSDIYANDSATGSVSIDIENSVFCLLENSTQDPNAAVNVCGDPRLGNIWLAYTLVVYACVVFSILPFFVFGYIVILLIPNIRSCKSFHTLHTQGWWSPVEDDIEYATIHKYQKVGIQHLWGVE
jgi:hypothetical protein